MLLPTPPRGFDGSGIGGGIGIADSEALLVPCGLREHTP